MAGVSRAQEFRAAWADVFHVGMGSTNEVNNMVSTLVSGNYNAVVVQVLAYMDNSVPSHGAHWKSSILPWSSRVKSNFDPLAYLCQRAHANGIEVHAWLGGSGASMYRVSNVWPPPGNSFLASHPEWFMVPRTNSEGGSVVGFLVNSTTYYSLDMGSPDVQEYLVSIIRELATNYEIDGINWDDEIDGPVYNAGVGFPAVSVENYPNSGLGRYRRNTGYVGTPGATDPAYNDYRRRFKNELMARVQAEIQSIKTNPRQPLRHTTAALAYSPVPPNCDFTASTPYIYYCDWAGMLQNGWVDAVIPQTYSVSTFNTWADRIANCWQANRHVFPGIGAYLNTDASIADMIRYTRSKGLKGNSIYSYAVPTSGSGGGSGWWAYAKANVYTNKVSTPPMPWRNPATATEGIIWGRVKNGSTGVYLDDATVIVSGGPTVKTDGNGYYVATMVSATAAGTAHLTTAGKTGLVNSTSNVIALAGDIVRCDFVLNPITGLPSAPSDLAATAVSSSQVNLSWTDNSTNETTFILARSLSSGGPYSDIATIGSNTVSVSDTGLAQSTTYFYVVRATNSVGASANSAQASATTLANPAPEISIQPRDQSVVVGSAATFSVMATGSAPLQFQWYLNGSPIPGATSNPLDISSAQFSNGGIYSVAVSNAFGSVVSSNASLAVWTQKPLLQISNIWNIQAGSRPYVTTGNTERGLCLNPFTDHVLIVSRSAELPGAFGIFVLDASTGAQVGTMITNGIANSGTFILNKMDVADDGAIYGGNLTTSSASVPFVIYRWAHENAAPTVAYSGSPDGGATARWGDTFSVSGAGTNTRIMISGSGATNTVVFTTSNGTNFVANKVNPTPAVTAAEFSRGLHLLGTNTFWVKNRGTDVSRIYNYSVPESSASIASEMAPLEFNMLAICAVTNFDLLAGIIDDNSANNSGHLLKVYDVSSPGSPMVVSNFNYLPLGSGTNSANPNFGAAIDTDGTRIVGLDTQNGVVAVQIVPMNPPPYINSVTLLPLSRRRFHLNADPGNFSIQASSDLSNWFDLTVTRTNGLFEIIDSVTNSPARFYRTKSQP